MCFQPLVERYGYMRMGCAIRSIADLARGSSASHTTVRRGGKQTLMSMLGDDYASYMKWTKRLIPFLLWPEFLLKDRRGRSAMLSREHVGNLTTKRSLPVRSFGPLHRQ
jgi:hypothetical protein